MWREGIIVALVLPPILGDCSGGTRSVQAPPPPVDPWKAKLDQMRKDYEANEAKTLADWRQTVKDAQAGDVDALKIDHEIQDLRQEMAANQGALEGWDRELRNELQRRGITAPGK
jgi:hypothetical protein